MFYKFFQPLLFKFSPECLHDAAIIALKNNIVCARSTPFYPRLQSNLLGKNFAHPIGLAAGFDKNAECIKNLSNQGFSFLELGTVTPKAQSGNSKPRIFRISDEKSLVNSLGFNNKGSEYFLNQIENSSTTLPIGINIGKNKDSDESDYLLLLEKMHNKSEYITINISSPNTSGLRDLQQKGKIEDFLQKIKDKIEELQINTPIFLKIAPDMNYEDLKNLVENIMKYSCFKGLVVSNTTIDHDHQYSGGLSGKQLFNKSTTTLQKVHEITQGKLILIGVGGISSADDVIKKMQSGAHLVQLYTAFIYEGFGIIQEILTELDEKLSNHSIKDINEIIGNNKLDIL